MKDKVYCKSCVFYKTCVVPKEKNKNNGCIDFKEEFLDKNYCTMCKFFKYISTNGRMSGVEFACGHPSIKENNWYEKKDYIFLKTDNKNENHDCKDWERER